MLKAAPVPQQLTPLLQDAACQVDGISRLLLPVTQSRRGIQTNASSMCLLYCFAYSQELAKQRATRGADKPPSAPVSVLYRQRLRSTANLWDCMRSKKGRIYKIYNTKVQVQRRCSLMFHLDESQTARISYFTTALLFFISTLLEHVVV